VAQSSAVMVGARIRVVGVGKCSRLTGVILIALVG
jgi:hypothetical protein